MRAACLLLILAAAAAGRDMEVDPAVRERRLQRKKAIQAGLRYLRRVRQRDGSFGRTDTGVVGITSLCLLAFMAAGHQENRGPYGDVLRDGTDFLLSHSLPLPRRGRGLSSYGKPAGYIYVRGDQDSRMHGHGYATQVLVLAYGSAGKNASRRRELRIKVERAIAVIENSQTLTGGWGYEPNRTNRHEGSITVTVVQALRLARDAGFVVDKRVHEAGLRYLHDSQNDDGSFRYSITSDTSTAALTAAALTALHDFAEYYSRSVRMGLRYLESRYRRPGPGQVRWTFYSNFYTAQAFYRAGGSRWRFWNESGVPWILAKQAANGAWDDREGGRARRAHGRAYATALSCLALAVPDGYLPLFQR